jgi:lysophospholipase L1-like esterase
MSKQLMKVSFLGMYFAVLNTLPVFADTINVPTRWIGRTDTSSKRFAWPGSGMELRFTGSTASTTLTDDGNNSVIVEVDGQPRRLDLVKGNKTYVLTEKLEQGEHIIKLMRRTEGAPTQFIDATTDGTFIAAEAPKRNIAVIGDSISAGYGIEGGNERCVASPENENQYLTYAAITARSFGAEIISIAASGRGVTVNGDGKSDGTMPQLMDRTMPFTDAPLAKFAELGKPNVIVVHLGTNDFSYKRRPETFEKDYGDLLAKLRGENPSAVIFAAIGPMLDRYDFPVARDSIAKVVSDRAHSGDKSIYMIIFEPGMGGFGCDWHPNLEANRQMAKQLEAAIAGVLGWSIQ